VLSHGSAGVERLDIEVAPYLTPTDDRVAPTTGTHTSSLESLTELVESDWLTTDGTLYDLTDRGRTVAERLTVVIAEQYDTAVAVLETMALKLSDEGDGGAQSPAQ